MQKSMTGFGKEEASINGKNIVVEIRAVNSKQLDLNIRTPQIYRGAEARIRSLSSDKLIRGRIDIFLDVEISDISDDIINKNLYKKYLQELREMTTSELGEDILLPVIIRLPDVLKQQKESIADNELEEVIGMCLKAMTHVNTFREKEGLGLEKDILKHAEAINQKIPAIEKFEKERIKNIREKLLSQISSLPEQIQSDPNRFEQELIYYIEKIDITEEKIRLAQHCEHFIKTLSEEAAAGKKLGFIAQEMGREINTIGAKANHFEIQKTVVEMKDELEKIKEQLSNVL